MRKARSTHGRARIRRHEKSGRGLLHKLFRGKKEIDVNELRDFISECLAVEKGGVQLYSRSVSEVQDPEIRQRLQKFLEQTENHVRLLEDFIQEQGWDVNYLSAGARAAQEKAETLIRQRVDAEILTVNAIENLVIAETKDHFDWAVLSELAKFGRGTDLGKSLKEMADQVEAEEDEHIRWAQDKLRELVLEKLAAPAEKEVTDTER
jgi:rubrerythrin